MNLIDDGWVPVTDFNFTVQRISLRNALVNATSFRTIQHASPLVTVAVYRLLLAVLQRVFGTATTEERVAWWREGRFPQAPLEAYFERWADRFNLFDDERPFMQVVDMTLEMSKFPWTELAAECSSGNNKTLFDHHFDDAPGSAAPDDALLYMLAKQVFALSCKSVFKHNQNAYSATSAFFLVEGANLFETLASNLSYQDAARHAVDAARWELDLSLTVAHMRAGPKVHARSIAQLYSWPSRSVRLFRDAPGKGVSLVAVASGEQIEDLSGATRDPMVSYRVDKKYGRLSLSIDPERSCWRDFMALRPIASVSDAWQSPETIQSAARLNLALRMRRYRAFRLLGQVTQQGGVKMWTDQRFEIPAEMLGDSPLWQVVQDAIALAEDVGKVLGDATRLLAHRLKSRPNGDADPKAVDALKRSMPIAPHYWSQLDRAFREWLPTLSSNDPARATREWIGIVKDALDDAWRLADRVVPNTGRGDMAWLVPDRVLRTKVRALLDQAMPPEPDTDTEIAPPPLEFTP